MLITGASGGIGSATAALAAEHGYRLVLVGRDAERLSAVAQDKDAIVCPADVTDWDQLVSVVDQAKRSFGRLDVAFANAGRFAAPLLLGEDAAVDEWREMVLTNVYGTALTARAAWPELVASGGHLVLTGSVAGRVTVPASLYSATKWGVTALGQSLRAAGVGSGVRVTTVQPGLTDGAYVAPHRKDDPKLQPDDVARAVLYAVEQPPHVDVSEILVRPTGQAPFR